jgi:hypothetical protein
VALILPEKKPAAPERAKRLPDRLNLEVVKHSSQRANARPPHPYAKIVTIDEGIFV